MHRGRSWGTKPTWQWLHTSVFAQLPSRRSLLEWGCASHTLQDLLCRAFAWCVLVPEAGGSISPFLQLVEVLVGAESPSGVSAVPPTVGN